MNCLLNVYKVSGLILENQSPYSNWSCTPGHSGVSQVTVRVRDHDRLTQIDSDISIEEVFVLKQLPIVTVMVELTSTLYVVTPTSGEVQEAQYTEHGACIGRAGSS